MSHLLSRGILRLHHVSSLVLQVRVVDEERAVCQLDVPLVVQGLSMTRPGYFGGGSAGSLAHERGGMPRSRHHI